MPAEPFGRDQFKELARTVAEVRAMFQIQPRDVAGKTIYRAHDDLGASRRLVRRDDGQRRFRDAYAGQEVALSFLRLCQTLLRRGGRDP